MQYLVEIEQTLSKQLKVEADTADEAIRHDNTYTPNGSITRSKMPFI